MVSATSPPPRRPSNRKFRSKFSVSYEALLAGEHPWLAVSGATSSSSLSGAPTPLGSSYSNASSSYFSSKGKKPSAPRSRFYADILCLKVEAATLEELVQNIPARTLVDDDEGSKGARIRDNIGSLWRECLRVWSHVEQSSDGSSSPTLRFDHGSGTDEVRRLNAIDTLLVLSGSILSKSALTHSSTSLDLIWIFAGGIDEADDVFEGLVHALDEGLRGELDDVTHQRTQRRASRMPSSDTHANQQHAAPVRTGLPTLAQFLHHRIKAVHLAIVWISHISSSNLSAYFVRRDLFVAACSLLTTVQSIKENAKSSAAQGRGGLAEADEDLLRTVVRDVALLIGLLAGLGQGGISSGSGNSGGAYSMTGTSHSPYFRRLCDWVDSGSMQLLRDSASQDFERTWKAFEADSSPFVSNNAALWGTAASLGVVSEGVKRLGMSRTGSGVADPSTSSAVGAGLPPACACSLLPIFLLIRANQAFIDIALSTNIKPHDAGTNGANVQDTQQTTFASSLLTLSSYLSTHASVSARSKSYSRLTMMVALALLSSTAGMSAVVLSERPEELALIKQCQQRSGPKPVGGGAGSIDASNSGGGAGGISNLLSQLSFGGSTSASRKATRLLPFILDSCVQYLRNNLRKRLDVSGYLICLEVIKLSIDACAERRILLEYAGWLEVWRSIQTVITFLVGRHTELRGIEVGQLGKSLLSTLAVALKESDHFLKEKEDVNVLIYELVRSSETLRRLACISVTGKDPSDASIDAAILNGEADRIVDGLPGWKLLDMVLLAFERSLDEWKERKGGNGGFSMGLSIANLTGGYFKGSQDAAPKSSTKDMPDVGTVMQLIAALDLERLVAAVGGMEASQLGSRASKRPGRVSLLDEEMLERAESQCISEAFRCASEDMRALIATPTISHDTQ